MIKLKDIKYAAFRFIGYILIITGFLIAKILPIYALVILLVKCEHQEFLLILLSLFGYLILTAVSFYFGNKIFNWGDWILMNKSKKDVSLLNLNK
jgi:hypothetical protein